MRTMLAFTVACTLIGGCAVAPYEEDVDFARYYGQLRGNERLQRDPIPYRYDGDYHRRFNDRDEDLGHHDQWR